MVIINCASASGPFINRLSGNNRLVVTATKSGYEMNFARFGQYIAEAIADERADIDKDGQVSLLEAFLTGSSRVDEYYRTHSQLASEHALLDDNGDRLGTPANWFHGIRATKRAKDGATLDGTRAHQLHLIPSNRERGIPAEIRQRRDQLELSIAALTGSKGQAGRRSILRPAREADGRAGPFVSQICQVASPSPRRTRACSLIAAKLKSGSVVAAPITVALAAPVGPGVRSRRIRKGPCRASRPRRLTGCSSPCS